MAERNGGALRCTVALLCAVAAAVPGLASCSGEARAVDEPWAHVPPPHPHTDHADLIRGPFADGPAVTRHCLTCHPDAAREVQATSHWTWISAEVERPGGGEPLKVGKRNMINNFCIAVPGNWPRCTSCHAGYGWRDDSFDFSDETAVDCLVCHDRSGQYVKDPAGAGLPAEGVDLEAAAKSVDRPQRANCGACHFSGGGGDAVKHGDMDATMKFPSSRIDVHMGKHGFECVDCHVAEDHEIMGQLPSLSNRAEIAIHCTDCHVESPHEDERLNSHFATVSCQACHIPYYAVEAKTKLSWDWSTAGLEAAPDDRVYSKSKGSFVFGRQVPPVYSWFDGRVALYLPGDKIDPEEVTRLSCPEAGIDMSAAKLRPFKLHTGRQIYDLNYKHLLVPKLYGPGGYWETFDWDSALVLGAEASGVPYSGEYGWAETTMCWPITHMVQPKERALQCTDCHGPAATRLDWEKLGFTGDPAYRGTRRRAGLVAAEGAAP